MRTVVSQQTAGRQPPKSRLPDPAVTWSSDAAGQGLLGTSSPAFCSRNAGRRQDHARFKLSDGFPFHVLGLGSSAGRDATSLAFRRAGIDWKGSRGWERTSEGTIGDKKEFGGFTGVWKKKGQRKRENLVPVTFGNAPLCLFSVAFPKRQRSRKQWVHSVNPVS